MNLANSISKAYKTKWSYINSFNVEFIFNPYNSSVHRLLKAANIQKWKNDDIQLHIISVDTPTLTNSPIEVFQADQWRIHNGRDEVYRFSITFRDKDQLYWYRAFQRMYTAQRLSYFDEVKFNVKISKDPDWSGQVLTPILLLEDCLIESISALSFNNTTENQVAEFSVGFKSAKSLAYKS